GNSSTLAASNERDSSRSSVGARRTLGARGRPRSIASCVSRRNRPVSPSSAIRSSPSPFGRIFFQSPFLMRAPRRLARPPLEPDRLVHFLLSAGARVGADTFLEDFFPQSTLRCRCCPEKL